MRGEFTIDGDNSYTNYRVLVEQYGYKGLIAVPQLKGIEVTEWRDEDGIEADLSSPVIGARTVPLQFVFTDINMMGIFFDVITDGTYHEFSFTEIGLTVSLRLQSSPSLSSFIRIGRVSMTFVEDRPIIPAASPYALGATRVTQRGYELDGIDLSRCGCWVLDGIQNILKPPAVKENVTVNKSNTAGQTYMPQYHLDDTDEVTDVFFKSKDVTLNLLINARSLTEFWRCWNSLFSILTDADERELSVADAGEFHSCYFKSNSVTRFDIRQSGTVWCEFSVTLTFLDFRPAAEILILATEDGAVIITEGDGAYVNVTPSAFKSNLETIWRLSP